ncbi:helix-turn-helix transcriptional regulator [Paenibacillus sp. FSL R10-2782]|uniref:helix-turn-helix domain-containing protein n=1 Tax=Paenibacillus sp. FSL R10-2782 TaxID=2954661 RepID=UPI00315955B1
MGLRETEIAETLDRLMKKKGLTRYKLAKLTGVPYTTLIKIMDGTTKNPQIDTLSTLADFLGVTVDYLSGDSIGAIIEFELIMEGMTVDELAEKAGVNKSFILNVDKVTPDAGDYVTIEKIARALKLTPSKLRSALARQEPPAYDGPSLTPEEAFKELQKDFEDEDFDTVAAHHEGEDWSEEELAEIERFKEFVRSKRKGR